MDVGYIGTRNNAKGTVKVCKECADINPVSPDGHSFAPVYSTDTYITHTGGMTCDTCQTRFI
jgi:hypothetical protein